MSIESEDSVFSFWEEGIPEVPDPEVEGIGYPVSVIKFIIDKYFERPLSDAQVVDLGSGRGYGISHALHQLGAQSITGLDISPKILRHSIYQRATMVVDCSGDLPISSECADIVVSTGSHGLGYENWSEVYRILKSEGLYLATDSNKPPRHLDFEMMIPMRDIKGQLKACCPEIWNEAAPFFEANDITLPLVLVK